MCRRFVTEAVMVAANGQLLAPSRPVEYIIPFSTIQELYEMKDSPEPVMPQPDEDRYVRKAIGELIAFFEEPLNSKKIDRATQSPWRKSAPLLVNESVSFTVIYAMENAEYGEGFDPIETELILSAVREKAPILTDQFDFLDRLLEAEVQVEVFDIDDFEFAVETDPSETGGLLH